MMPEKKSKIRKIFCWLLGILLGLCFLAYAGITAYMASIQSSFIFPGHEFQRDEEVQNIPCAKNDNDRLIPITLQSGIQTTLWYKTHPAETSSDAPSDEANASPAKPAARPTVLFIYGNRGSLASSGKMLDWLYREGADAACIDLPGFGIASGEPSEKGFYEAVEAAYDYLTGEAGVLPENLFVLGHSLGTGSAANLSVRRKVAGTILAAGFTDIGSLAQSYFPFLPCKMVVVYRFNSYKKIPKFSAPLLIIHSQDDTIVPYWMGEKNFAQAQKNGIDAHFLRLQSAGHDLFEGFDESPEVWKWIGAFIRNEPLPE